MRLMWSVISRIIYPYVINVNATFVKESFILLRISIILKYINIPVSLSTCLAFIHTLAWYKCLNLPSLAADLQIGRKGSLDTT